MITCFPVLVELENCDMSDTTADSEMSYIRPNTLLPIEEGEEVPCLSPVDADRPSAD